MFLRFLCHRLEDLDRNIRRRLGNLEFQVVAESTYGIVDYCVVCVRHILEVESGMLICVRVERVDFNIIFVHFLIQTESGQLRLVRAIVDRRADTVRICIKRLIGGAEAR